MNMKNKTSKGVRSIAFEIPEDLPDLANATPSFLVDEIGYLRECMKLIKKREGYFKEALIARLEPAQATIDGERYSALIENLSRSGLNTEKIRAEMSVEWIELHTTTTDYVQIKTTRRK